MIIAPAYSIDQLNAIIELVLSSFSIVGITTAYGFIDWIDRSSENEGTHLERIKKIIEAPGNDDVVIKRHEEGDDARCYSYTA